MINKVEKIIDLKKLIKLIIIFIIFYCNKYLKYIPIIILNMKRKNINFETEILLSVFASIVTLIILLIIYRKDLKKYVKEIKNNFYKKIDKSFKYYLLGLLGMIITNIIVTNVFKGSGAGNEKLVQEMINTLPLLMLIDAGIIAPIIEELVFRKAFMDAFKNKWLFILLSSTIFGLLHVISIADNLIDYLYFIPYTSLGIALAYMDTKENNVIPSIIMHMGHNTFLIILSIIINMI